MLREMESLGVLAAVIQAPELHAQVPLNFHIASSTCPHAAFLRGLSASRAHCTLCPCMCCLPRCHHSAAED